MSDYEIDEDIFDSFDFWISNIELIIRMLFEIQLLKIVKTMIVA